MKEYFKSPFIIFLIIVIALLLALMLYSYITQRDMTVVQNIIGTVFSPIQRGATAVKDFFSEKLEYFTEFDRLKAENELLKMKLRELEENTEETEELREENINLRQYLGLKEEHPDYQLVYAEVIGREPGNFYSLFTIDKGTASGVSKNDIVVTPEGITGVVVEAGLNFAKVSSILESLTSIGAMVTRTKEPAVIVGDEELAKEGLCSMIMLQSEQAAAAGDTVRTSGLGGNYPKGLVIGTVKEVIINRYDKSVSAVIEPAADFAKIKNVVVITGFDAEE